jgi:hypothetical protein
VRAHPNQYEPQFATTFHNLVAKLDPPQFPRLPALTCWARVDPSLPETGKRQPNRAPDVTVSCLRPDPDVAQKRLRAPASDPRKRDRSLQMLTGEGESCASGTYDSSMQARTTMDLVSTDTPYRPTKARLSQWD